MCFFRKAKIAADRAERGFAPLEEEAEGDKKDFLGNKKVACGPALRAELRAIKNEHEPLKDAAFKALLAYVSNIVDNPHDPKVKKNCASMGHTQFCGGPAKSTRWCCSGWPPEFGSDALVVSLSFGGST